MVTWSIWISSAKASTDYVTQFNPSSLTSTQQSDMETTLLTWDSQGESFDAETGLFTAAEAGGAESSLLGLGSGFVAPSLAIASIPYITYRVASSLGVGGWVYREITGSAEPNITPQYINNTYNSVYWRLSGSPPSWSAWTGNGASALDVWCSTGLNYADGETGVIKALLQPMGVALYVSWGGGYCNGGTPYISTPTSTTGDPADSPMGFAVEPATSSQWSSDPNAVTLPGTEPTTCNLTCLENGTAAINCNTPTAQTGRDAAACAALATSAGLQAGTFRLLDPLPNETYITYEARLQNAGWLGTATNTQEGTALSGYGPLAITRVTYLDSDGKTVTLDPLNWPATAPVVAPGTSLTIRYNPSTAVPAPSVSSPSTSCGATADTACQVEDISTGPDNNVGTIDWTPLESLDLGSKFPFGVAAYINSFFGSIPTSGSCPDLNINKPSALGGGTLSISFCNTAWETTYRPTVFLVLEALMTLAGVVFLAQKITGVGSTDE